jgi:cysteine-rich repeat protein
VLRSVVSVSLAATLGCSFASLAEDTDSATSETGGGGSSSTDATTSPGDGNGDDGDGDGDTGDGDGDTGNGDAGDGDTGDTGDGDGTDCGNGVIDAGESCDGIELGAADCTTLGFVLPSGLACGADCSYDVSACTAFCGNGTIEPGESCEDGNQDPDDGCDACQATGVTCASAIPMVVGFGLDAMASGSTVGGGMHDSDACAGADASPDRVFVLETLGNGFVSVWLDRPGTPYDAQLYSLQDCVDPGSASLCVDLKAATPTAASGEALSFWSTAGQTTTLVVDGRDGSAGAFELHAHLAAGTCGDPVVVPFWPGGARPMVGRTTSQPDGPPASCGGAGAGEVVYQVDAIGGGSVEIIAPQSSATFPMVGSVRTDCADASSELACDGSGDVVLSFAGTMASSTFVIIDGAGAGTGEYSFIVGG